MLTDFWFVLGTMVSTLLVFYSANPMEVVPHLGWYFVSVLQVRKQA